MFFELTITKDTAPGVSGSENEPLTVAVGNGLLKHLVILPVGQNLGCEFSIVEGVVLLISHACYN